MRAQDLQRALSEGRYETARRIGNKLLQEETNERVSVLFLLHDALVLLADFGTAKDLLESNQEILQSHGFQSALRKASDYRTLAEEGHYRTSKEGRQGYTIDEYIDKYNGLALQSLREARALAQAPEEQEQLSQFEAGPTPAPFSRPESIPALPESKERGNLRGRILLPDGSPAARSTATLGLHVAVESPDFSTFTSSGMHSHPRIGPLRKIVAQTDAQGNFEMDDIPCGTHDFLAVTLDPTQWEVPTRFLRREIAVTADHETDLGEITAEVWQSAPPRPFQSPHPDSFEDQGTVWNKCGEWKLRNPFYYEFPRQLLTLSVPERSKGFRIRIDPQRDEPFQISQDGANLLTELGPKSEKVIAVYESPNTAHKSPFPQHPLRLEKEEEGSWIIETGAASYRLAGDEPSADIAPILAVKGIDQKWRGRGRFRLPEGVRVAHRDTQLLEKGPLLIRVRSNYTFSNGCQYSLEMTALSGEPLLLIHERSDHLEGAAFEFSLPELSGGRGYLHWTPESGSHHWRTLEARDEIIGQLPESVPWWIPPQGFGYAMTPEGLEEADYIGIFTRRRGQWIDRAFEKIAQGPIDPDGTENCELEWPHPEMVGSSISMIYAHTDASGDAFYRFGFFDGERQWALYVSDFGLNDGPGKDFGRKQHAYSSPRLQEYKDWHFDVEDTQTRPHLVAQREKLPGLRIKSHSGPFQGLWEKIRREPELPGPRDGLLFAIDNDPLIAWEKRILLNYVAENRSTMTLLGRDWSDMYSPVGGRDITKWAEEYDLVAASGVFTPEEERQIRDFFILMGHLYMEEDFMNWRFNGRNANFEADRTDIVGAIGLVFQGHPDSKKFVDHVLERTRKALLAYCTPGSGRWYENPACYYLHASRCRINLVYHLAHKGLVDLQSIPRLKEFLRWGILLLTPPHASTYSVMRDGAETAFLEDDKVRKVPPVGDHAGIGKWLSEHYAYMGKMFRDTDPEFARELIDAYFVANADGLRLLGKASWENQSPESTPDGSMTGAVAGNLPLLFCNFDVSDIPENPSLRLQSRRLEGFGGVFRNGVNTDSESYLLVKQGPGGYRYHRTEGSFILFSEGRPLVFDGGEAGETWRHSTLSFHDVHMPLSPARVERHFDARGVQFIQGAHPVILKPGEPVFLNDSCRHELVEEAYRRFQIDPPAVARSFSWIDNEYLLIHDDLSASRPNLSHWHIQVVGGTPETLGPHDYRFPGRFGMDLRVVLPDQEFDGEKVENLPILHYSGTPESWFSMEHLQLSLRDANQYLAALHPVRSGMPDPFTIEAIRNENGIVGARISSENRKDLHWFCRSGLSWEESKIRFSGSYGALLRTGSQTRLVLFGAGNLQSKEILLQSDGPNAVLTLEGRSLGLEAIGDGKIIIKTPSLSREFVVSNGDGLQFNHG
ncbi:hypothetical protein [Puniceicoccus vermicola]|uniref:Heparin-sulfate lyase N-terminal domain-containing protein n=1 Tax=Puniceicoccus vermicola TaxID=388746 RepID=A0A7X1E5L7_9BACT|nr:hypothetical protein [Puniceicoccus vermicola]MBC2603785.1 hypothetical protein [Puniceicoccus vermicola]